MPEVSYFRDIKRKPLPVLDDKVAGEQYIQNLLSLSVGAGTSVFRADSQGIWLGAERFADAPFRVTVAGALYFRSATGQAIQIDSNGITQYDSNGIPVGFWGFQTNGF